MLFQKISIPTPRMFFFCLTPPQPHLSRNSAMVSYFSLEILAFQTLACVASISVVLGFSLFEGAKIGVSAKKVREGGWEGRKGKACPQTP